MKTELFDYDLPKQYIAQFPPKRRGTTKLLVLDRKTGNIVSRKYDDIPEYVKPGDIVVLNKTKVIKARIFPKVARTGKKIEVLLLDQILDKISGQKEKEINSFPEYWFCLVGRAKDVKIGDNLVLGNFELQITDREPDSPRFVIGLRNSRLLLRKYGHVPLPAYIKRPDLPSDKVRYNTVFAHEEGSVAAPTASLNLTRSMINRIKQAGAKICYINLEVGWGTFAPVNTENIQDFKIHEERIEVPQATVDLVNSAKGRSTKNSGEDKVTSGRIWAFGTTVVRALESVAVGDHKIKPFSGSTKLFIYPGYKFKIVDLMVTNFHMPKSSLMMLISAFASREMIMNAYNHAQEKDYKFLSYGDSMLIL